MNKFKRSPYYLFVPFVAIAILVYANISLSQRTESGKVFNEVLISEYQGCYYICVQFDYPMRYMNHFPFDQGKELRIELQPMDVIRSDVPALFRVEAASLPDDHFPLSEVVWEGLMGNSLYLTLHFQEEESYSVSQCTNFRGVLVTVPEKDRAGECPTNRTQEQSAE